MPGIIIKEGGLYYPSAINWMWDYCIHLGKFKNGKHEYDLGVYCPCAGDVSFAIVYGNEPGDYISGDIGYTIGTCDREHKLETIKRWEEYKKKRDSGEGDDDSGI
jgi:hypothetical protein